MSALVAERERETERERKTEGRGEEGTREKGEKDDKTFNVWGMSNLLTSASLPTAATNCDCVLASASFFSSAFGTATIQKGMAQESAFKQAHPCNDTPNQEKIEQMLLYVH